MKKRLVICFLMLVIAFSSKFSSTEIRSNNTEHSYYSEDINPILSNGVDVADEWYLTEGSAGLDIAYDVAVSSSTGYIFIAGSETFYGDRLSGSIRIFNSSRSPKEIYSTFSYTHDNHFYALITDSFGDVIAVGDYYQEGIGFYCTYLVKFNSTGGVIWAKTYGTNTETKCYGITVDLSDNIYLGGEVINPSRGTSDMCVIKFNSSGDFKWIRTWGGNFPDQCFDVAIDSSGNIFLAGNTWSYGLGASDMCLVKFNSSGDYKWNTTWGGISLDFCTSIAVDSTKNIYLAGYTLSTFADYDICLVKYNSSGDLQWNRTWGDVFDDYGFDIELDSLGNIYLGGETRIFDRDWSDMCLLKYNTSGDLQWFCTWGGDSEETCYGITIDPVGSIYLAGKTRSYGNGFFDMCIVKYSSKPKITIISPKTNGYHGAISPYFALSIFEPDLDKIWYTIDEGITNIACNLTGQIDQTEWDEKDDGPVILRFYAKDIKNNEAFSEIKITKDTIPPNITIHKPLPNTRYITGNPCFHVLIEEIGLNSSWYTIDNGLTNITIYNIDPYHFNDIFGFISETEWYIAPKGRITITFYAKDAAGNIASASVNVYKGSKPFIPGYNLILIIGIISVGSIIPIMKLKRR